MRKLVGLFLAVFVSAHAFGQTEIKVEAPNIVAVDEQFNLTFVIEDGASPSDFTWASGSDFQLVWGPQKGSSVYTSIINGKRSKTSRFTYTYVLLPRQVGTFTIPRASATIKGKTITSSPISIKVVSDGGGASSSSGSSQSSSGTSTTAGEVSRDDLFMRLNLSSSRVVVGEPVTATLKLYQRVNIAGLEDAKFPSFDGCWSQESYTPTNVEFTRESLDDKIYNTAVLRSWTLIPQQAGDITIEPAELVCLVNVRAPSSPATSIFDSFFQDEYRTIRKRVTTGARTLHVSALPTGAPSSFGGGVGTFSIRASVSKDSLKAHDAASLIIKISGKGNISLLETPKVNFPPDFELYDVKVSDSVDKSGNLSGSKTFEFPFIPRSGGDFVLEPIEYSYYDITAGKYVTLHTEPIRIKVAKDDNPQLATGIPSGTSPSIVRKDVKSLGEDIRFIFTGNPHLSAGNAFFLGSVTFYIVLILLFMLALAVYFASMLSRNRKADVVGSRKRQATKMARKRLARAGAYLKGNLYTAFYEELHRALLGFVADKLSINFSDMSKENIEETLISGGLSKELAESFTSLLDACEYARYAPDAGHEAMNAHYESALNVVSSIDTGMKPHKNNSARGVSAILALLFLFSPFAAQASVDYPDSLWNVGVDAYTQGEWDVAASAWSGIASLSVASPELEYNLGNAMFKCGDYARAILHYERALKLDPSYSDARFNLEFTNSLIQDKIDSVPEFFLVQWLRGLCWKLNSDVWTWLFLAFLAFALGCTVCLLLSHRARRLSFLGGIVALVLALLSLAFAIWQHSDSRRSDAAIVLVPVTSVKSSPDSSSSKDLFILHEGTKVRVLDELGNWRNIELSDGRQGWMKSADMEII